MKNKKTPGQVVVIITLFIAVMILLTVVLINIAKVSDMKTVTSQIADSGALNMGSVLGSYVNLLNNKVAERIGILHLGNCAPNWGLVLIIVGFICTLILAPLVSTLTGMALLLGFVGFYNVAGGLLALADINKTQKQVFADALYSMTAYTGFRESVISSMLGGLQTDTVIVTQNPSNPNQFLDTSVAPPVVYDLTNTPYLPHVLETVRQNKPVYRYNAWYWSNRFPRVSEAEILKPFIDENTGLIKTIIDHTKIEEWDPNRWEITKLTLKTRPMRVTQDTEKWVVKGTNEIRVVGPVKLNDWAVDYLHLEGLLNLIFGEGGFLVTKFINLTERLIEANYHITYSKRGAYTLFNIPLPWGYDHKEIFKVNDDVRGFLTRSMELMNLPVSYRVVAMTNWLPTFYNGAEESMYTRLLADQALIGKWLTELSNIDNNIVAPLVPRDNGDCDTGADGVSNSCMPCTCCDSSGCWCCGSNPCAWHGVYCSCTPGIYSELCGHGDLYGWRPSPCPPVHSYVCCDGCGNDAGTDPAINMACRFQGDDNWAPKMGGDTEVRQAIKILQDMNQALADFTNKIGALANVANSVMAPTQLKEQATYGWIDKRGVHHVISVRVDGYPVYSSFPAIVEDDGGIPFDLVKCWNVKGTIEGWVKTTVSSYSSDVNAGWWNIRMRRAVNQPEYAKDRLRLLIEEIHTHSTDRFLQLTAHKVDFDALMMNYAIRSATNGHWGANKKNQIYIQKAVP